MFNTLCEINKRPTLFSEFSTSDLWADPYISKQMLEFHLDRDNDMASRNHDFIDKSVEWIAQRFNINSETEICDFGCGPGLYTSRFAKLGAKVTGIDFSGNSVDYARQAAADADLKIGYVHGNYLEFQSDKTFDLITMIFCDFSVLPPSERTALLKIVSKHLKPGGSLLLDVFSHSHFDSVSEESKIENSEKDGFWTAEPYIRFENTFKYDKEKIYISKHTIIESNRKREIFVYHQCYNPEILQNEFMKNGLRIKEFYSDVAGAIYSCETPQFAVSAAIL